MGKFRVGRFVGRTLGPASPLNFGSQLKAGFLPSMEIREVLVVTPVSTTRRFHPVRWRLRRAGTGRAPRASHCWRRHSNLASACTRFFVRRGRHRLSRRVAERRNLREN